ncbi:excalibur calcium-binding domain-containing protein [Gallaecimonas mangrovi]|uniref:excalibur calcium-binding domain-containing protein n=1 Tax=Gallaecimonas mangrovi TaxID=2291597 RepID=UPI000E20C639|nr:excalibur calcium-binding domain-containing protein [Gallaecimonas mangrovi]
MKFSQLAIVVLAGLGAFQYFYQHKKPPRVKTVVALPKKALPAPPTFHCEGKVYCSQMGSRAEANFYLAHCPGTKMDGDNDGIPCENDSRW